MEEIQVFDKGGADAKEKKRSFSYGFTAWATDAERHKWFKARTEIINRTSQSTSAVTFRATYIGLQYWEYALEHGLNHEQMKQLFDKALAETHVDESNSISDMLDAWAQESEIAGDEQRARSERMVKALERLGIDKFIQATKEIQPDWDPIAWMKQAGLVYDLSWHEKTRRLLIAYFVQHGEMPRGTVIEWAKKIGLVEGNNGSTIGAFVKLVSEEGFSGAGQQGMWDIPDRLRSEKVTIDIENLETIDNMDIVATFGGEMRIEPLHDLTYNIPVKR